MTQVIVNAHLHSPSPQVFYCSPVAGVSLHGVRVPDGTWNREGRVGCGRSISALAVKVISGPGLGPSGGVNRDRLLC